jgi:hypothetical protein
MPALQAPVTHALAAGGTLVSSSTVVVPPRPSQTMRWQSPSVCIETDVPSFA